jgi:hypothetical protein
MSMGRMSSHLIERGQVTAPLFGESEKAREDARTLTLPEWARELLLEEG